MNDKIEDVCLSTPSSLLPLIGTSSNDSSYFDLKALTEMATNVNLVLRKTNIMKTNDQAD